MDPIPVPPIAPLPAVPVDPFETKAIVVPRGARLLLVARYRGDASEGEVEAAHRMLGRAVAELGAFPVLLPETVSLDGYLLPDPAEPAASSTPTGAPAPTTEPTL
jgi:hypothetical protein